MNKTLAQDTEAAARPEEEELDRMEAPRKQHGDALLDGSGTRHGVDDAQTRPNL